MFYTFLLVVQIIIAAALVAVILMQRSEGGGLAGGGGGGSGGGLMSARGVGDFLTRTTAILGTLFIINSIGLAVLASVDRTPRKIDTSLSVTRQVVPDADVTPVPVAAGDNAAAGAEATGDSSPVPLAE